MAEIQVQSVSVEIRTVTLTAKVLKQLPEIGYHQLKSLVLDSGHLKPDAVIGWVHGSVLDRSEDYKRWLIVKTGPFTYGRYEAMDSTCKDYPQLIIP